MIRVLIVDDAIIMRSFLRKLLENNNFIVVGEATNGRDAILKARELQPDIITMDITMPLLDGISATLEIKKENANAKICIVSAMGQECMIKDSITAGAMGFLIKPYREAEVIKTLNSIYNKNI